MFVSVKDIFDIKAIEGIRLIAGKGGINNNVNNTNIMDNPDSFDWFVPGDLIITTGFVFKDDIDFQVKVVRELAELNCSALMIKTRKYFGEMPKEMIEEANKYNLPLIEIPKEYSLAQVSSAVNNRIFQNHDSMLKKTLEIHNNFTSISLKGGGLNEIANNIIGLVNNPIVIVDYEWKLLTYADHPDNPYPLKDILNLKNRERVFPFEITINVPNDVAKFKKSIKRKLNTNSKEIVCRIMPIAAINQLFGYMVILETVSKLKMIDYIALENASTVAALDRIKAKEIEEIKYQIKRDFFDDLLSGKIESISTINNQAEIHGMDTSRKYVCMVIKIDSNNEGNKDDIILNKRMLRVTIDNLIKIGNEVAADNKVSVIPIYRGNQIILFISNKTTQNPEAIKSLTKEFGISLYNKAMEDLNDIEIYIGIGTLYESILKLYLSFSEAQEVIKLGRKLDRVEHVLHFDDFLIYHLLSTGTTKSELENFYNKTIVKLDKYDSENNTNLVGTLEQYFIYQGNISEAAKELFIHRNTFIYRMDKIKMILETDLKDAEEVLELQLGLKVKQILKIH